MPTDDDYDRRERLLLHKHPTSQYGQQSATLPALSSLLSATTPQQQQHSGVDNKSSVSTTGISDLPSDVVTTDCYHKQQQQHQSYQRSISLSSSTSSVSSNVICGTPSIVCHQDRYQINERLQSNEGISECGVRIAHERYDKINDKQQQHQQHYANKTDDTPVIYGDTSSSRTMETSTSEAARHTIGTNQDQRFSQPTSSSLQIGHRVYGTVSVATGRPSSTLPNQTGAALFQSSVLADRYSRYTEVSSLAGDQRLSLQPSDRFQPISETVEEQQQQQQRSLYNHGRSTSPSLFSDERADHEIANNTKNSATNEYANSSIIASSVIGGGNVSCAANNNSNSVFSPDTFPSPPSPAPASDRFVPPPPLSPSPSEKYSSSQSLTGNCYSNISDDRILPPNSPSTTDRYVTAPASPLAMSKNTRYSTISSDRGSLVTERVESPCHEAKGHNQQQQQRYGTSSTECLLSSASPVLGVLQSRLSENSRGSIFQVNSGLKESTSSSVSSRYSISSDRLISSSPIHAPVPERFAASGKSTDRYHGSESPTHENTERYHYRQDMVSSSVHLDRYANSSGVVVGNATERYLSSSPKPEGAHGRYLSTERILVNTTSSKDHSSTRQSRRYSTSERSLEGICQKYAERGESRVCSSSGSPANTANYSCRFVSFQEVTMQPRYPPDQRFSDVASLQRYCGQATNVSRLEQTRTNERFINFNNERYLSNASPGHDSRVGHNADVVRYSNCDSSTERLLASTSSPSNSDNGRYHMTLYGTGTTNCSQTKSDRYGPLSPTPENNQSGSTRNYSQPSSTTKCNVNTGTSDKYIQVSKSLQVPYGGAERYHPIGNSQMESFERTAQERASYAIDRYNNPTSSADQRYQVSGNIAGFHSLNPERFSPGRAGPSDNYLSLPKSKDDFVTGRIVTSCSAVGVGTVGAGNISTSSNDRSYSTNETGSYVPPNAHTPVERYVPQPPPEVLYPERYADRYIPPAAHTPTDRYVPAADPGDPYMRRDLGFHHHYRLPPPGYPYHQAHFRFRSFAYASPGRLGGSPGSSSSSSSTSAQREFSTSPLLRQKVRNSTIELTNSTRQVNAANQATCCNDLARNCCPPVRRSLPPVALPSIPNQSAHLSW